MSAEPTYGLLAEFFQLEELLQAVLRTRTESPGASVEAYSPFRIEGLDEALGATRSLYARADGPRWPAGRARHVRPRGVFGYGRLSHQRRGPPTGELAGLRTSGRRNGRTGSGAVWSHCHAHRQCAAAPASSAVRCPGVRARQCGWFLPLAARLRRRYGGREELPAEALTCSVYEVHS